MFFSIFCHIPGTTMWISHFFTLSLFFFAIFQVLQCLCTIFHIFQFSCHNPGLLCVFLIFYVFHCLKPYSRFLECAFLIFHVFECFLPYSRSNSVCVSFSTFLSFLAIVQVYFVYFSFSTFFNVSSHILGPTVFVSHFPRFSVFFAIFQVLPC